MERSPGGSRSERKKVGSGRVKRMRQALSACNNAHNCTTACVVNDSGGMPGQVLVFREDRRKQGEEGGERESSSRDTKQRALKEVKESG